jgi:hypothetical protein
MVEQPFAEILELVPSRVDFAELDREVGRKVT